MASKHRLLATYYICVVQLLIVMTAFRYVDGSRLESHHLEKLVDRRWSGNNLKPHFTTISGIITIKEDVKVGSVIFVLSASDNENDTLTFSLDSTGQSLFNVGPLNADTKSVNLTLKTALNRELNATYEFKAFVTDNPSDITKRGEKTFFATVVDVNDNKPVFSKQSYRVSVLENATLNTLLLTVSATDADEGTNGDVKYRFSNDSRSGDKFEIHLNGTITLKGALDYEKESSYELTVVAEDGGVPQQRKTCTVVINVIDISDMPPVFNRSIYIAKIKENSPKASEVPEPGSNAPTRVEVEVLGNTSVQSTQTARTFLETKNKATAERKSSNQFIFLASATGFLLIWLLIWKLPAVLDMLC